MRVEIPIIELEVSGFYISGVLAASGYSLASLALFILTLGLAFYVGELIKKEGRLPVLSS